MIALDRYQNVMVGADPEFFLYDPEREVYVSAIGKIGGTKENPRPIDNKGSFVQEDNVLGEMNIIPAKTSMEFVNNVDLVRKYLKRHVFPLRMNFSPVVNFTMADLDSPAAWVNGCDEDFSAWEKVENEIPSLIGNTQRTAGGHIHISYDKPTISSMLDLIKALDIFVGVPLSRYEHNSVRQETYGRAGNFRPKDYGVEYRTPSSLWAESNDKVYAVFESVIQTISWLNKGMRVNDDDYEYVQKAIELFHESSRSHIRHNYVLKSGISIFEE